MGETASRFDQCGCVGGRAKPTPGKFFVGEEASPTRCCLPQVDPLHYVRTQELRDLAEMYDCKVMFRQAKKRVDGMQKESPDANKSGWPIDLPNLAPSEQPLPYYSDILDFNAQIRDVCYTMLGDRAEPYLSGNWGGPTVPGNRWKSLKEYEEGFYELKGRRGFPRPRLLQNWMSDEEFARQRLRGPNQSVLRQIKRDLPKVFKVQDSDVLGRIDEPTLADAMKAGRVFIVDYSGLFKQCVRYGKKDEKEDLAHKPPRRMAVLCNPIALFYKRPDDPLMPLAIQLYGEGCDADKVPVNPVYTPDDNLWAWTIAKCYFNQADLHHHIIGICYMQTVMVGAALQAMVNKTLSIHHPVRQILRPHIKGCLAFATAWHKMMSSGELILDWLALDMEGEVTEGDGTLGSQATHKGGLKELAKFEYLRYDFNNLSFKHDWRERLDKDDGLTDYHYRDDGQRLWDALEEYVMKVVMKYYTKADDIEDDEELKAWIREMSNRITRVMELHPARPWEPIVFNITTIIFVCSILYQVHVHEIYDHFGCVVAYPGNAMAAPPIEKTKDEMTEKDLVALLPDKRSTLLQIATCYVIQRHHTGTATTPFGRYPDDIFVDKSAKKYTEAFQARLDELESYIDERNQKLDLPYTCFHPKYLRNSFGTF